MMHGTRTVLPALALLWAVACAGQQGAARQQGGPVDPALLQELMSMATEPAVARAHWGVSVVQLDGTVDVAFNAGQFFQPASNAKLFTTAAAMALLPMEERLRTQVVGVGEEKEGGEFQGSLFLDGGADANLSGRAIPYQAPVPGQAAQVRDELRYVEQLADQLKAAHLTSVTGDVVGDDRLMPWDPYPQDWSIDDAPWYYGAPVNALMVGDNSVTLRVAPGDAGKPAAATIDPALPYYALDAQVMTGEVTSLDVQRHIGSRTVRVRGTIAAGAAPYEQGLSIEDPAEYAAMALRAALEARGIQVGGHARAQHQPFFEPDFAKAAAVPLGTIVRATDFFYGVPRCDSFTNHTAPRGPCALAEHVGHPLAEDIVVTNKTSQNQHAELLLRMLGLAQAQAGTTVNGARVVRAFLTQKAGVDGGDFVFVDGSGLSGHDLVTPRATTTLLRYAAGQPWGEQWKESLPVGGVDGSLRSRFTGELKGRVFAKTGTLGEARALSGYLVGNSGRTVVFSVMVTGHTPLDRTDEAVMDRMVAAIAAAE